MGRLLGSTEQQIVHDNHAEFETRVHSQYAKYLESPPFFTDYYSISSLASTVDTGLLNVDKLSGEKSPIKYNLIKNFPMFGLEQVQLDIEDNDDIGLQTSYQGEAVILPNTIRPQVDDRFYMTAVGRHFMFRVIDIHYDTILPRNYWKIEFMVESSDDMSIYERVKKGVIRTFFAVYDNYGTQDKFIIEESQFVSAEKIQSIINQISDTYMRAFYNEKYNALMVKDPYSYGLIYDAFVNHFCNEESIFAKNPKNIWNYKFYEELRPEFKYLYHGNSIQAVFKDKYLQLLDSQRFMKYYEFIPAFTDSIFQYYGDFDTKAVTISNKPLNMFRQPNRCAFPEGWIEDMISGAVDTPDMLHNILVDWLHEEYTGIQSELEKFQGKYRFRMDYTNYLLIPLLLYVLYEQKAYIMGHTGLPIQTEHTENSSGFIYGIPDYVYKAKGDIRSNNDVSAGAVRD